jgi:beta-mannanase
MYGNAAKTTAGQNPGSVLDYAVKARKSTTLSQMYALEFLDNRGAPKASQYANQSGGNGVLDAWALTGRRMVIGTCGICVEGDTYAQCASGAYDGYWNALGDSLIRNNMTNAILRPACEADNPWNYQNAQSRAHPADYIAAQRRFYTIIKAKVPTVTVCWNPTSDVAAAYLGTSGFDTYYPGDAYCDWIGLDCYDSWSSGGATPTSPWTTAQKQNLWDTNTGPKMQNVASYAQKHGKPLALPEWGLRLWDNSSGGDDEIYVNNMVAFITNTANNVVFHAFWEDTANSGEGVFDPDSGRAWKTPNARAALNTALGSVF